MSYRQQTRSIGIGRYIKLIILIIIVLLLSGTRVAYSISGLLQKIARPLWSVILLDADGGFEMKARLEDMRIMALSAEVDRLRMLVGRGEDTERLLAAVVSPESISFYDTFWIDVGLISGVERGDLVVGGEGVALGKIVETFPNISKVQLFSAYGSEVIARILDTEVMIRGIGSQNFALDIPKDHGAGEGDLLIYPGLNPLILGVVGRIETSANNPLARIFIRSPLNIQNISRVYVVK